MITCQDIFDEASDYYDGAQDDARRELYEAHLARCALCTHFYRGFASILAAAREALGAEPPPERVEALIRQWRERIATRE